METCLIREEALTDHLEKMAHNKTDGIKVYEGFGTRYKDAVKYFAALPEKIGGNNASYSINEKYLLPNGLLLLRVSSSIASDVTLPYPNPDLYEFNFAVNGLEHCKKFPISVVLVHDNHALTTDHLYEHIQNSHKIQEFRTDDKGGLNPRRYGNGVLS